MDTNYGDGVLIGTGIAVVWYTVETLYLRRAMVRANELAVLPLVIAGIEFVEVSGIQGQNYAQKIVLRNLGKSPALSVHVADFAIERTDLGTMGMRIEGPDLLDVGVTSPVDSYGFFGDGKTETKTVDTLVPHLRASATKTHEIVISYADIAGNRYRSVMRMGTGGPKLLSHGRDDARRAR